MGEQPNIGINLTALVILHSAAVKLSFINRAKNFIRGIETKDEKLQQAIEYVGGKIREAVGQ